MSGRPFIAISSKGSQWQLRKYRPAANGSWDVWYWAGGWSFFDNVGEESAIRAIDEADEVFFESLAGKSLAFEEVMAWAVDEREGIAENARLHNEACDSERCEDDDFGKFVDGMRRL